MTKRFQTLLSKFNLRRYTVEGFTAAFGEKDGTKLATLCFFCGILITYGLDFIVHKIGEYQKRKVGPDGWCSPHHRMPFNSGNEGSIGRCRYIASRAER